MSRSYTKQPYHPNQFGMFGQTDYNFFSRIIEMIWGSGEKYSDIPFLSAWAIKNKNRKMMLAWWDEFKTWLIEHPEFKVSTDDAISTVTLGEGGKVIARYPDLDSYVETFVYNPNTAVDKWLTAMERALPEDVIIRGESTINPQWLVPKSIWMGMQGISIGGTEISMKWVFAALIISGLAYWKFNRK